MAPPARLARVRRRWRLLVGLVGIAIAAWALASQRAQLSGSVAIVLHANAVLGAIAFVLEAASDTAWALMTYVLLPSGTRLGWVRFLAISLAALSITNSIPFGAGVSAVWVVTQLHEADVDVLAAASVIAASNLVAMGTLIALFALALVVHAPASSVLSSLDDALIVAVGIAAALALWQLERLSAAFAELLTRLATRMRWRRLATSARRLQPLRIPPRRLGASIGLGAGNWAFDFGALLVALAAVDAHVSVAAAASAYVVGALATNLPITPGGLGVVEGSITVALVAFGGAPAPMLAAVILYRLASYWIWLPIGWAAYFWIARRPTHATT